MFTLGLGLLGFTSLITIHLPRHKMQLFLISYWWGKKSRLFDGDAFQGEQCRSLSVLLVWTPVSTPSVWLHCLRALVEWNLSPHALKSTTSSNFQVRMDSSSLLLLTQQKSRQKNSGDDMSLSWIWSVLCRVNMKGDSVVPSRPPFCFAAFTPQCSGGGQSALSN